MNNPFFPLFLIVLWIGSVVIFGSVVSAAADKICKAIRETQGGE